MRWLLSGMNVGRMSGSDDESGDSGGGSDGEDVHQHTPDETDVE